MTFTFIKGAVLAGSLALPQTGPAPDVSTRSQIVDPPVAVQVCPNAAACPDQ